MENSGGAIAWGGREEGEEGERGGEIIEEVGGGEREVIGGEG